MLKRMRSRGLLRPVKKDSVKAPLIARNRSLLVRNRSWTLLEGRNQEPVIEAGIAKKLAIVSGEELPDPGLGAVKAGQLFLKKSANKQTMFYYEED